MNLLENEQTIDFFKSYREHLVLRWENADSVEEREEYHRLLTTLKAFKIHLNNYVLGEKFAELREKQTGTG